MVVRKLTNKLSVKNFLLGLYVLAVLGLSAAARAEESSTGIHTKSYCGELFVDVQGRPYLIDAEERVYRLMRSGSDLDWAEFNGEAVQVYGVLNDFKQIGEPVFELMSLDPLSSSQPTKTDTPVLFVFSIARLSLER